MAGRPPRDPSIGDGKIANASLAEAVANGQVAVVRFLVEDSKVNVDEPGKDGTTPLCAAALWGNEAIVSYLLSHGADISAQNIATKWTALHAAAFQEHGKVCMTLLQKGAAADAKDHKGRTPADYASISEAIWPFFGAQGCVRSDKERLVGKGIIRRTPEAKQEAKQSNNDTVVKYSRPGSAYVRCSYNPLRPASAQYAQGQKPKGPSLHQGAGGRIAMDSQMPGSDPLGNEEEVAGKTASAADLNFGQLGI